MVFVKISIFSCGQLKTTIYTPLFDDFLVYFNKYGSQNCLLYFDQAWQPKGND